MYIVSPILDENFSKKREETYVKIRKSLEFELPVFISM